MAAAIHPVILAGGSGARLWPMSRTLRPKQLLPLVTERTMLQDTVARIAGGDFAAPTIVCNEEHRFMIAEQVRQIGVRPAAIMLEPIARNTAPAIVVAALHLAFADPDGLVLVLPADHVVEDEEGFEAAVEIAAGAARRGVLATFGITPTRPETGYGYIRHGAPVEGVVGCFHIESFVEKPDPETARAYLESGEYAWNSGMFLFPLRGFLDEVARLQPAILEGCRRALADAVEDLDFLRLARAPFETIPALSVDHAIMEHTQCGGVVPADLGWSDVGSWSALWEIGTHDADGNVAVGPVVAHDIHGCYVRAENNLIAAIGVRDLVIVATDDAVLVVPRDRAQEVRDIVERLKAAGRCEHHVHRRVLRPWGWYQSIDAGERFHVKQIVVHPGHRLSSQMHHHRAEHWVVVSGTARVVRGDETFFLTEDQSTYIPHNTRHALENPGKVPLRLIEVQSGGYLGEDDIVRFDDVYGRSGGSAPW